jgi:hypothetical protein
MAAAGPNGQLHSGGGAGRPVESTREGRPIAERPPAAVSSGSLAELRRERLQLAERVASLTWDLGGLAYEMAIRDHYRLDVLARRAAELQQADAQLGEIERLLASAEGGIGGACRACGAAHSRGAAYCWRCGSPLLLEGRPSVLPPAPAQERGPAVGDGASAAALRRTESP